ncbi:MAG: hypothetical protein ABIJ92_04605 [Candidatus Aenigmatarchaeota archaeon]
MGLIIDDFRDWAMESGPLTGTAVCGSPFEMQIILDYTGLRGSGSNIYYSLIYQAPKWNFKVKKVDEWIEVTPAFADYYNITIAQKQKIEGAIKSGLASASQSVADYELLAHDARRYREIIDYFKEGQKDDHVLRSLFLDRVDVYTGDNYSLVTMAKRWPTIITDFIRMESAWTNPDIIPEDKQVKLIMNNLDVSQAEATILKTKNQLFRKWKVMFFPVVKDRYARIQAMVEARRKSIDEYKNWLKPYVAKYRMIREKTELNPKEYVSNAYMTPGFGQSQASTGVRLWFFKVFPPEQMGKSESVRSDGKFMINPYDDLVKEWKKKIEEKYGVEITDDEVKKLLKEKSSGDNPEMDPGEIYYILIDLNIELALTKTPPPQGSEQDNLMFKPVRAWVMSQNVLLIHLLEIYAIEKSFDKYVNEMVGAPSIEKNILENIEKEFEEPKTEKMTGLKNAGRKINRAGRIFRKGGEKIFYVFVKKGPYETVFEERVSKMYMRGAGGQYGRVIGFIQQKMGVGN